MSDRKERPLYRGYDDETMEHLKHYFKMDDSDALLKLIKKHGIEGDPD